MKAELFTFVAALLTITCAAPGQTQNSAAAPAQRRRPNIVMVLVDDMRWDEMRISGHPFVDTPNMDRLAREGARFTNAFATTPLCSPSRATFLTGQYPHINGIIDNTARPSHSLRVFPLELQRAGYRTGFFGKWHMGNDDSPRPGFDHWVAMPGQGEAIDPSLNVDGERVHAKGYTTDLLTDYVERFQLLLFLDGWRFNFERASRVASAAPAVSFNAAVSIDSDPPPHISRWWPTCPAGT